MRDEFERNRYWIGIYRTDVEFDEGLGDFGRYVSSGAREVDTGDLETFNERWEAYANAWSFQQKKLDDLKQIVEAWKLVENQGGLKIEVNTELDFNGDFIDKRVAFGCAIFVLERIRVEKVSAKIEEVAKKGFDELLKEIL